MSEACQCPECGRAGYNAAVCLSCERARWVDPKDAEIASLRQQVADLEAENKRLLWEAKQHAEAVEAWASTCASNQRAVEAAESERDGLREAVRVLGRAYAYWTRWLGDDLPIESRRMIDMVQSNPLAAAAAKETP